MPITPDKKDVNQESDSNLVKFVNDEYNKRVEQRKPYELQWRLNIEFHAGNQYVDIRANMNDVVALPKFYEYQQREVFNHIAPIMETRLSKLSRVNPGLVCRPGSGERQDISASKVSSAIVKGVHRQVKMQEKMMQGTAWSELTGTVFYEQQWDAKAGNSLGVLDNKQVNEGDVTEDAFSSFEALPDSPFRNDIDECKSFIRAKAFHIDEIQQRWGKKIKGRKVNVFYTSQSNISCGGLGYTASTQMIQTKDVDDHEIVKQYYEIPSEDYPEGRFIIVAGNELLYKGPLPHKVGCHNERAIPIVRQVCIIRPGYFWGISIIERLIPIQRSYNAVKNRKHEYLNRCVFGVLTYEEGSVDIETIESEGLPPGATVSYTPGHKPPQFLENPKLAAEFEREEERLLNDFTVISGVSTFSRESAPPVGANSGIAMEIVREQDDTRLSLTAENMRGAIIKIGSQWLKLCKQYAKGPRIIKYPGKDNITHVMEWEASDITTTDVILDTQNELAQTPAQRKQFIFDLDARGIFNDPATGQRTKRGTSKLLSMLQLGENWEDFDDVDDKHILRAQRENTYFEQGQIPQIQTYDDDNLHIEEHLSYILTSDFEDMSVEKPDWAKVLVQHMEEHKMAVQSKVAQQAMAMQPQMPVQL